VSEGSIDLALKTATIVVAIGGILFAYIQLKSVRANQRRTIVRQIFKDYLLLACNNPALAFPEGHLRFDFERRTANGSSETFERYEWFLSYTLFACSEAVNIAKRDKDSVYWKELAQQQVDYHWQYLTWRTGWEAKSSSYVF